MLFLEVLVEQGGTLSHHFVTTIIERWWGLLNTQVDTPVDTCWFGWPVIVW